MEDVLGADPPFALLRSGVSITLRAQVVCRSDSGHLCCTHGRKQFFRTDMAIPRWTHQFVMTAGIFHHEQQGYWVRQSLATEIFPLPEISYEGLFRVVEVCAGMGIVDEGYRACGAEVICMVDHNKRYCEWARNHHACPVVESDIHDMHTITQLMHQVKESHVLSGGTACQPFSKLGDQKEQHDERSRSLPGLLRAAYMLSSLVVLVECTPEAQGSPWVQQCIREFVELTGYNCRQTTLHLHSLWPARRSRWWAVIAHPSVALPELAPLPGHRFEPAMMHLCPTMLQPSQQELEQLLLDQYEIDQFDASVGGIGRKCVNMLSPMGVATHSWGSQARACECGCRQAGFSRARVQDKGLYAVLIPVPDTSCIRHPDPKEVALFNGLVPSFLGDNSELRFKLSGVGQMATPFQSAWLLGQLLWHQGNRGFLPEQEHPRQVILQLCHQLLTERDHLFNFRVTPHMRIFFREIVALVRPSVFPSDPFAQDEEELSTQEIIAHLDQADCEAAETRADDQQEALKECSPSEPIKNPSSYIMEENHATGEQEVKPLHATVEASDVDQTMDLTPTEANCEPTEDVIMRDLQCGGVPGFSTRSNIAPVVLQPPPEPVDSRAPASQEVHLPIDIQDSPMGEDQPEAVALQAENAPKEWTIPARTHAFVHQGEGTLHKIQWSDEDTTVSDILQAENVLHDQTNCVVTTALGNPIAHSTPAMQHEVYHIGPMTPVRMTTNPPILCKETRGKLLWEQQAWVADDEMRYYLSLLDAACPGCAGQVVVLTQDEDFPAKFTNHVLQALNQAHDQIDMPYQAMAFLVDHHWFPVIAHARTTPIHAS